MAPGGLLRVLYGMLALPGPVFPQHLCATQREGIRPSLPAILPEFGGRSAKCLGSLS